MKYIEAPNLFLKVRGETFSYRDLGPRNASSTIVLLNHWGAVLDNFDPRIVDNLTEKYRVITLNYRGIGSSSGIAPLTISEMALDTIDFIRAMGLSKVILFGFSLGGFVAQDIALKSPDLVEKLILTGTGPAGGEGIENVGKISFPLILKGLFTLRDPKHYLFFTTTKNGQAHAKSFLLRLKERKNNRDRDPSMKSFLRQLKAIKSWGQQSPQNISSIKVPVLIANGDNDIMVPTSNSRLMAKKIPNSQLVIYEDAGHGGIFQYYLDFNSKLNTFLEQL